ncbi:membrane protein [Undibacterium sp. KW1]|uniref:CPBP family intramembrane glutamic endopeptidase n=1 Tax=Undibacterium sp. KW1 TaxID=2058624 RepID=UPI001331FC65|nr:CPBP family intramembrane glutamic endopeptidase [Undibacterium sp. KW1]BBB62763.1 membrane protein [Undibacterium sp. KW1]
MTTAEITTSLDKPVWHQKLLQYTIVKFLLAVLIVGGVQFVSRKAMSHFLGGPDWVVFRNITAMLLGWLSYAFYVRVIEKRKATELALFSAWKEWLIGLVLGAMLFVLVLGSLSLLGVFHVDGYNDPRLMLKYLPIFVVVAVMEELFFRAMIFRMMEESLGSAVAILISALAFGFAHASNPGATVFSSIAIALEAGIAFGAAYMLTRRLALCIAMHFSWNFTQGAVFSVAVSGTDSKGWLQTHMTGSEWLSGGAFGAEASVLAVFLATLMGVVFLYLAWKKGEVKSGFWKKPRQLAAA